MRETVIDGVRIRDHRGDAAVADDLPPALHRPSGRRLPATLTHEVSARILAAIAPCAEAVPREARGDKPRIEGVVDVAISDGQLAITKASIKLREVVGAAVAPTEQCMSDAVVGLRLATEEPAVASYALNLRYAFP